MPRRPNTDRARELRRDQSPPEGVLWSRLRDRRLNGIKFRRQHTIGPYIADFYCPDAMLVIEIDSKFHIHPDNAAHDLKRDAYMQREGYAVLRVAVSDITKDITRVLTNIDRAVAKRIEQLSQSHE